LMSIISESVPTYITPPDVVQNVLDITKDVAEVLRMSTLLSET